MELREFGFARYKGYTEPTRIELAPLTILVGANNSGKTALARTLGVCRAHRLPHHLLGAGFNTVVRDGGLEGVVLRLSKLRHLEERPACGLLIRHA